MLTIQSSPLFDRDTVRQIFKLLVTGVSVSKCPLAIEMLTKNVNRNGNCLYEHFAATAVNRAGYLKR
ncbi:hypothetical protein T12_414 [Trichinella patagoniensis]|uniref:Uncharacterized protein n=1 Tax=Trichinella patagoniensis TaxID=990121 RepID=A0A0V0ZYA5_9BILA|nr:hypothetical protein T12_414 [Trichinella patagoniensis]